MSYMKLILSYNIQIVEHTRKVHISCDVFNNYKQISGWDYHCYGILDTICRYSDIIYVSIHPYILLLQSHITLCTCENVNSSLKLILGTRKNGIYISNKVYTLLLIPDYTFLAVLNSKLRHTCGASIINLMV